MTYTVRPLSDRTWLRRPAARQPTRFSSKWVETEYLLLDEVERLDGRDLVIEVDVREQDLRRDGSLRANAREADTPAVVVAFETTKHGPMLYRCDTFTAPYTYQGPDWQHNVRAIALTLQSLRAVDRYGATDTGQQYTGFKALPAGTAMPASHMTRDQALGILGDWGRRNSSLPAIPAEHVSTHHEDLAGLHRAARRAAHPDRNHGDQAAWDQIEQAARVLGIDR